MMFPIKSVTGNPHTRRGTNPCNAIPRKKIKITVIVSFRCDRYKKMPLKSEECCGYLQYLHSQKASLHCERALSKLNTVSTKSLRKIKTR